MQIWGWLQVNSEKTEGSEMGKEVFEALRS